MYRVSVTRGMTAKAAGVHMATVEPSRSPRPASTNARTNMFHRRQSPDGRGLAAGHGDARAADPRAAARWELGRGVVRVVIGVLAVGALPFLFADFGSTHSGAEARLYSDPSTVLSSGGYSAHDLVVQLGASPDVVAVEVAEFPLVFALPWAGRPGLEIGTIDLADPDAGISIPRVLVQTTSSAGTCVEAPRIVEVDGRQITIRAFVPTVTMHGGLLIDARGVAPDRLTAPVVRLHYEDGSTEDLRAVPLTENHDRRSFARRFTIVADACTVPAGSATALQVGTSYNRYRLHSGNATYLGRGEL